MSRTVGVRCWRRIDRLLRDASPVNPDLAADLPDDLPADAADTEAVDLVVDVANVMGSRPDGWWHDRAGAAERLARQLAALPGTVVTGPGGRPLRLRRVHAVVEGRARDVPEVEGVQLVRASADGDTSVVQICADILDVGDRPLTVTADRGLRARLPAGTAMAGPRWLLGLLTGRPS